MNGFYVTGFAVYTAVIINANIMVLLIAKVWSILLYGTIITFLVFYFLLNLMMSKFNNIPGIEDNIYFGIVYRLFHNMNLFNILLLIFGWTMLLELAYFNY